MIKSKFPKIMIAGTHSGCGKTTIICGILKAICERNLKVRSFKCGPDYIDPMFHRKVMNVQSSNLDIFLTGENKVKYLFNRNSNGYDISIVEGVMGFYDGLGLDSYYASSYHLSEILNIPVIIVLDCKGMSFSVSALLKGFKEFKKNNIAGCILNNISSSLFEQYKRTIETNIGINVFGYMPKMKDIHINSRHLGLIKPEELENINEIIERISEQIKKSVDIDAIIDTALNSKSFYYEDIYIKKINKKVNIAFAYDDAFCFYYEDNIKLLNYIGADIIYFSPLKDSNIPENTDGIIISGGYPELYLNKLSSNKQMISSIKNAYKKGIKIFAECGGFMYLHDKMCGYNMVGIIKGETIMTDKLQNFGYVNLKANEDNILCGINDCINAHEFHYSKSSLLKKSFTALKKDGRKWDCIYTDKNIFAGYPHINLWGNIEFAYNFLNSCIY